MELEEEAEFEEFLELEDDEVLGLEGKGKGSKHPTVSPEQSAVEHCCAISSAPESLKQTPTTFHTQLSTMQHCMPLHSGNSAS